jgi:GT2 family glycosyltransferase
VEGNVAVGYIHDGWPRAEFMASVLRLVTGSEALPEVGGIMDASAGAAVGLARTILTQQFLDSHLEWLWMVDTDMVFSPAALTSLLRAADPIDVPIVSGLAHIWDQGQVWPAVYAAQMEGGALTYVRQAQVPEDQLLRVAGTGAACLLVHRRALEAIAKHHDGEPAWWREVVLDRMALSEDLSFCFRAASAGLPIHVHTGVQVGHMKTVMLGQVT